MEMNIWEHEIVFIGVYDPTDDLNSKIEDAFQDRRIFILCTTCVTLLLP